MPLEDNHNFLTLCEPHACWLLRGNVDLKWAGHNIKVRGASRKATSTQPTTIEVRDIVEVGKKCSQSCEPIIPGRGVKNKDKPGGEGGTPGVVPKSTTPPD